MTVFGNYAQYYDLLYQEKDYAGEADFVHQLIQTHAPNTQTLLEFGCGTGQHARLLAENGYQIHGIDISADMLQQANDCLAKLPQELTSRLTFSHGDIRTVRLSQQFDALISLFHVISYQTTNEALQQTFLTAETHLKPGGLFIFDCWYGPGVLSDPPVIRVKRLQDETIHITRIAEPIIHPNQNTVDVKYTIFIQDRHTGKIEELRETHQMRYLFKPELEILIADNQLKVIDYGEWLTKIEPNLKTWYAYFVIKKQG